MIADATLSTAGAGLPLLDGIERVGPFGAGNPEPLFLFPDMLIVYAGVVGTDHVRIRAVGRDGQGIGAIAFRAAQSALGQALLNAKGRRVHLAAKLKRDDFDRSSQGATASRGCRARRSMILEFIALGR